VVVSATSGYSTHADPRNLLNDETLTQLRALKERLQSAI